MAYPESVAAPGTIELCLRRHTVQCVAPRELVLSLETYEIQLENITIHVYP